ncbi:hypothetical protein LZ554_003183 [Drepanopeziza brunnea f. sp. 'monogermtubi']|nr:hypothetical protein LZ554_003183 [Drepanopeziza brunnea f. sp. 'monogermtubi']
MKALTLLMLFASAISKVTSSAASRHGGHATPSLLIFSKTEGWRHDSIPSGIKLVTSIARQKGWSVAATEDSSVFTAQGLANYTTLVFLQTTGNFMQRNETDALYSFLQNGGTWLGVHAAGDYGDLMPKWYGELVGAQFAYHACVTDALCSDKQRELYPPNGNERRDTVNLTDTTHPSTRHLPASHRRTDEWYSYKTNPSRNGSTYTVLAELREDYIDRYTPAVIRMHPNHPIAWYHVFEGRARAFYTGMGHTNASYAEDYFVRHLTGALEWVAGVDDDDEGH